MVLEQRQRPGAAGVAELGETPDPRALVPGDPAALHDTIGSLTEYGNSLVRAG